TSSCPNCAATVVYTGDLPCREPVKMQIFLILLFVSDQLGVVRNFLLIRDRTVIPVPRESMLCLRLYLQLPFYHFHNF
ncbi:MAG TPA: hypothetical protein VKH62_17055, partial [Candidatus Binatia bacterium]|nr:hypothetical protein [Candidatus Binatia bacterium]